MTNNSRVEKKRSKSDEYYVIDLCDEILGFKAARQHRFSFLRGGYKEANPKGSTLPVDAYYKDLDLVIEYWERQHTESVPFFDNKKTRYGVPRKVLREAYDNRRKEVLPQHGIKLVIIQYKDLGDFKRIQRIHDHDKNIIKEILHKNNVFASKNNQ